MARHHSGDLTIDAQTAAFDAVFAELIGQGEEVLTHLEPDQLQPLIDSIETLVGSAGRAPRRAPTRRAAAPAFRQPLGSPRRRPPRPGPTHDPPRGGRRRGGGARWTGADGRIAACRRRAAR